MTNNTLGNIFKGDKVVWMIFFFLCIISIVEVFSASSSLTYKGGNYWSPIIKHISILLVVIFAGQSTNGAQRWISILGLQFQPSEIAKGTVVLATAQILSAMQTEKGADKNAFKYILIVCLFTVPLIMLENLSTAILLCVVIFFMMLIGRVPAKQLGKLLGIVMLCVILMLAFVMLLGTDKSQENTNKVMTEQAISKQKQETGAMEKIFHRADTWKSRINKFVNGKEISPNEVDLDKDAQVAHANIAIASSSVIGKGPGNSVERDFLSQAFSDFIYAIIIEEMGILGAFFVAMLYIILLFRTGRIANRCENNFPAFLAMGLALLLVTQALFNMCVAVGLAPVTGQPLPLVSKGGTSTIINCVYMGAILSVSRTAKKKTETEHRTSVERTSATA